jgi:DNA-binding CsgD family transcriptional regulator/outer membrane protein assembly factor BamB
MTAEQPISEREREILRLVATGATNQQIAQQLNISINTVKVHLRNIFGKIGAASRTEATIYAVRAGIVTLGQADTADSAAAAKLDPPSVAVLESPAHEPVAPAVAQSSVAVISAPEPAQLLPPAPAAVAPAPEAPAAVEPLEAALRRPETQQVQQARQQRRLPAVLAVLAALAALGVIGALAGPLLRPQPAPGLAQTAAAEPAQNWSAQPNLPEGRAGSAAAAFSGRLLVVGGDTSGGVSGTVLQFEPTSKSWAQLPAKPTAVADIQAGLIGGELLVPGGRRADGQISADLEILNLSTRTWRRARPMPAARSAYALATLDGKLYVFGGYDGRQFRSEVFVYDPSSDTWLDRTPMPSARAFATAAAAIGDGTIFVIGGENERGPLAANQVYTPSLEGSQPWKERQSLPQGISKLGSGMVSSYIYTFGGGAQPYRYDIRADVWEALDASPAPIGARPAVASSDNTSLFIFGGQRGQLQSGVLEYRAVYVTNLPLITR